jgi:hypothetical protein
MMIMLVRRFRAFEALAVLAEALADNVERLTTFIRISSAGSMRAPQLSPDWAATVAISQAVTANSVSIWAVDYLMQQLRRYAPLHNGTIAPLRGLFANGIARYSYATPFASGRLDRRRPSSYNASGDHA